MNGAFRGSIIEQLLIALQASDRSGIHNRAAWFQMRQRGFGHIEIAKYVGPKSIFPLFFTQVAEGFLMPLESSIVDNNVQASKFLHCLLNRLAAKLWVLHIARNKNAMTAFRC